MFGGKIWDIEEPNSRSAIQEAGKFTESFLAGEHELMSTGTVECTTVQL